MEMEGLVIISSIVMTVFFIAVPIILGIWMSKGRKKKQDDWSLAAQSMGFEHNPVAMQGVIDGLPVSVKVESRRSGDSHQTFTVFRVNFRGLPAGLSIQSEGFVSKTKSLFGKGDVQLGLPDLDPKLLVKADDPDEVREWAQREGVAAGLRRISVFSFAVRQDFLLTVLKGIVTDPDTLRSQVQEVLEIAKLIAPQPSQNLDDAVF